MRKTLVSLNLMLWCSPVIAQYLNIRVSDSLSTSPEEVTIAVNPTNPQNLIAGANLRFSYYSTDGGLSWSQKLLPAGTYGDPCTIFDVNGRAYYAHLADMTNRGGYWLDRMVAHRSSDGGRTWYDSVATTPTSPKQQDKGWLVCDLTNSLFRNSIYMAWTQFDTYGSKSVFDSSRILFSRLAAGANAWTTPVRVNDESGNCLDSDSTVEGAVPAVGPNGEVYLAWAGPSGIMADRSYDGGATWGKDVFVTSMPGGWDYGVSGIYRCNGLPTTVCDISNSAYRGTVYILWADQRNGTDNTDVFLCKSTNQGATWSTARRVNTDAGKAQQFFPWIAVDQSTGYLYVVFYDRRNYGSSDSRTDVYLAQSTDAGETWNDFKISKTPFLPRPTIFFGDYINVAALGGKIYPIWMRLDSTKLSVWIALVDKSTTVQRVAPLPTDQIWLGQNYPNPFNPATTIEFFLPEPKYVSLEIYDILGRAVESLVHEMTSQGRHVVFWETGSIPSGVYFCRLRTYGFEETKKLVLMR